MYLCCQCFLISTISTFSDLFSFFVLMFGFRFILVIGGWIVDLGDFPLRVIILVEGLRLSIIICIVVWVLVVSSFCFVCGFV